MTDTDGYRCNSHRRDGTRRTEENCVECAYDEGSDNAGVDAHDEGYQLALREVRDAVEEIAASSLVTSWGGLAKVQKLFRANGKFEVENQ